MSTNDPGMSLYEAERLARLWEQQKLIGGDPYDAAVALLKELDAERERREAHTPRPVVAWFSGVMEERLRANDHKGGWSHCSQRFLLARIFEEVFELEAAIENGAIPADIESEAADVANFAMMLADVCGGDGRRTHDKTP